MPPLAHVDSVPTPDIESTPQVHIPETFFEDLQPWSAIAGYTESDSPLTDPRADVSTIRSMSSSHAPDHNSEQGQSGESPGSSGTFTAAAEFTESVTLEVQAPKSIPFWREWVVEILLCVCSLGSFISKSQLHNLNCTWATTLRLRK